MASPAPVILRSSRSERLEGRTGVFAAFLLLLAIVGVPLFSTVLPPLVDYPNHLARLHLIRRLQTEHLPLAEIRRRLEGLGEDEIRELARTGEPDPPTDSALEYRQVQAWRTAPISVISERPHVQLGVSAFRWPSCLVVRGRRWVAGLGA